MVRSERVGWFIDLKSFKNSMNILLEPLGSLELAVFEVTWAKEDIVLFLMPEVASVHMNV